jgi:hypothetical protein
MLHEGGIQRRPDEREEFFAVFFVDPEAFQGMDDTPGNTF